MIKEHPPLWEIYAEDIGVEDAQTRVQAIRAEFEAAQKKAGHIAKKPTLRELPNYWDSYKGGRYKSKYEVETGLSARRTGGVAARLTTYPRRFSHPSQGKKAARTTRRDGHGQTSGGLRHGRGSGVRQPGEGRRAGAAKRARQPARNLQPAPFRASRYRKRAGIRAAAAHFAQARRVAKSTIPRYRKPVCWASSTATAATIRRRWCSGRRSSATSSMSPKR